MSAVVARGVTKTFGSGALAYQALKGVDFSADEGEFVILNGPSGSGKTTLLSILGCVLAASSGSVKLLGEEVVGLKPSALPALRLAYIGFIFQEHNLIASLDALANVMLPLELRGWTRREARAEGLRLLDAVGLADKVDSRAAQLSGGQRQRVAVARALANDPPVILADEPTGSLDSKSSGQVFAILRDLVHAQGKTVVAVTHDLALAARMDRRVELMDGTIVADRRVEA